MKTLLSRIWRGVLLSALIGTAFAGDNKHDILIEEMRSASFAKREEAQTDLITWALEDPATSVKPIYARWKNGQDIELQSRLLSVLQVLYERVELGIGASSIDARFGWFLFHDGKYLSTYPQIVEVKKGGVAAKAGLLPGDVLLKVNDLGLWSDTSVPRLESYLKNLKLGATAKFEIRRVGDNDEDPFTWYYRYVKKSFEVVTVAQDHTLAEIPKGGFEKWLQELSTKPLEIE